MNTSENRKIKFQHHKNLTIKTSYTCKSSAGSICNTNNILGRGLEYSDIYSFLQECLILGLMLILIHVLNYFEDSSLKCS